MEHLKVILKFREKVKSDTANFRNSDGIRNIFSSLFLSSYLVVSEDSKFFLNVLKLTFFKSLRQSFLFGQWKCVCVGGVHAHGCACCHFRSLKGLSDNNILVGELHNIVESGQELVRHRFKCHFVTLTVAIWASFLTSQSFSFTISKFLQGCLKIK